MRALSPGIWLDAACGDGQLASLSCGNNAGIIGIDIDEQRLKRSQGHDYNLLVRGSVTELPFADNSLGGVVSIETLEHIEEASSALREFARCIRPGGYLIVSMPSVTLRTLWEMVRSHAPVYCDAQQHVRELSAVALKGFSHRFKTFRWIERELRCFGFRVEKRSGVGFLFPRWQGGLAWMEHGMNLLYREKVNRLFGRLPVLKNFPYYRVFIARRAEV